VRCWGKNEGAREALGEAELTLRDECLTHHACSLLELNLVAPPERARGLSARPREERRRQPLRSEGAVLLSAVPARMIVCRSGGRGKGGGSAVGQRPEEEVVVEGRWCRLGWEPGEGRKRAR
jgi:hypothetical protein